MQPTPNQPPHLSRQQLLEVAQDRARTQAWVQRQKDKASGVGTSTRATRSSSTSLEVEHNFIVIEDVNPPSELRKVVLPSEEHQDETRQPATQTVSLAASVSNKHIIQNAQSALEKVDTFAESTPMSLVVAPSSHASQPPSTPASVNIS